MAVHLYAVSVEMALIAVLVMMIIGILYYGFKPGDSWLMVLTSLAFCLKSLCGSASGRTGRKLKFRDPVGCGIFYYLIM
ncbi:MAG: hypothetical protein ACLVG5_03060 [Clostridium sp.]